MNATHVYLTRDERRWAAIALYTAAIVVLGDMYLTQPILPLLAGEFAIPPAVAGLSVSVVVLAIALASTTAGPISDLRGRKPVMVMSLGLLALPTLLCAFAPTFPVLLVLRALQGLCIPGLTAVAVAYLGDSVEPELLGGMVGGWIAANVAGGLVGRVASGVITDLWGWRMVFVIFAALTLASAVLLALRLPPDVIRAGQGMHTAGLRDVYGSMFAHLRHRRLVGAFLIGGALFFGFIGVFTYLPFYLTAPPFLVPAGLVAFAYLSYLAGVVVSPIAGRLSARIDRRVLIAVGLVIAIAGVGLTLIPNLAVIVTALFVLCTGMFTAQAVAPAFVNTVATTAKGGAGALYLSFYYVGGALGAALPGLAWQSFGWPGVTTICTAALALALLSDWILCRK